MSDANGQIEAKKQLFPGRAQELIEKYHIKRGARKSWLDAQRIGWLFQHEIVRIYSYRYGHDAQIVFRDWAYEQFLLCDPVEIENRNGKVVKNPYRNIQQRLYEKLDFHGPISVLKDLLSPARKPVTGRFPVTHWDY